MWLQFVSVWLEIVSLSDYTLWNSRDKAAQGMSMQLLLGSSSQSLLPCAPAACSFFEKAPAPQFLLERSSFTSRRHGRDQLCYLPKLAAVGPPVPPGLRSTP